MASSVSSHDEEEGLIPIERRSASATGSDDDEGSGGGAGGDGTAGGASSTQSTSLRPLLPRSTTTPNMGRHLEAGVRPRSTSAGDRGDAALRTSDGSAVSDIEARLVKGRSEVTGLLEQRAREEDQRFPLWRALMFAAPAFPAGATEALTFFAPLYYLNQLGFATSARVCVVCASFCARVIVRDRRGDR